jgi:hypothetical protein
MDKRSFLFACALSVVGLGLLVCFPLLASPPAEAATAAPVEESCSLTCRASVAPPDGPAPLTVEFTASVTATGCSGSPTWTWNFGDGQTSHEQNPTHTYTTPGTFTFTMSVTQSGLTCSLSGTVTATGGGPLCGDFNGDGVVTIGEVQKAINGFLGLPSYCN